MNNSCPSALSVSAAYLITFSCYGSHLPGHEGTTDRDHNVPGTRLRESQPRFRQYSEALLKQMPFELDVEQRGVVLRAICQGQCL